MKILMIDDDPDPYYVPAKNVVTKVCFSIPFLGSEEVLTYKPNQTHLIA